MRILSFPVPQLAAAITAVTLVGAVGCSSGESGVMSMVVNPQALTHIKTFAVSAPRPRQAEVEVTATNGSGRVAGAVIDMDPMLATSVVGRAMRQDLISAFEHRGYRSVERAPDFNVHYYAGAGAVVDTRASEGRYHVDGEKITTKTQEYPAGTIIVDVVDARSDSLVWRGTGLARISSNPEYYARSMRRTIDRVVAEFPRAKR